MKVKNLLSYTFALFLILLLNKIAIAQDTSIYKLKKSVKVENAVWGIQLGSVGIWGHGEFGFLDRFALRAEAGFGGNIWNIVMNTFIPYYGGGVLLSLPITVALEQRWYYHLADEDFLSKNTGHFVAVKVYSVLPWTLLYINRDSQNREHQTAFTSNPDVVSPAIAVMAKWGVRYTWWEHFTLEGGIGLGWGWRLRPLSPFDEISSELAIDIHLRIGYTF